MGRSGAYTYLDYGNESTFSTLAGALTRVFGMEQKITNVGLNQNMVNVTDLNSNTVKAFAYGQFEGSFDVDFILSNPWFLDLIFGTPTVTGTGPYTYTYPTTIPKTVTSFSAEIGSVLETASVQRQLLGAVVGSLRMSSRVNELVRCTLSNKYAKENTPGSTINNSPPTDSLSFPYTFEYAQISLPSGTPLAEVQAFELSVNPNISYVYGQNSKNPVSAWRGLTEITGRFNLTAKDATWITNVLARAEQATVQFVFDNGLAGTNSKKLTLTFNGVGLNTHSIAYNPNELILEDIPLVMRGVNSIVAINNLSAAP